MRNSRKRSWGAPLAMAAVMLPFGVGGVVYAFVVVPRDAPPVAADASPGTATRARTPALSIRAATPRRSVSPGWSVTYRLRIVRRPPSRVWLSVVAPLPANLSARFRVRSTSSTHATLTLWANSRAHPGTHRVRLRAHTRSCARPSCRTRHARTTVTAIVVRPPRRSFVIRGTPAPLLMPGVPAPVDLRLTNPHRYVLSVGYLEVRVVAVQAPEADTAHPCTPADFSVRQYSGPYGIRLPASRTRTLSGLGIPPGRWPQVTLEDRAVNQDGCKNSAYTLRFTGTAIRGHDPS